MNQQQQDRLNELEHIGLYYKLNKKNRTRFRAIVRDKLGVEVGGQQRRLKKTR